MSGTRPAEWEAWAVPVPPGYRVGGWEVVGGIATGSWGSVYEARKVSGARGPSSAGEDTGDSLSDASGVPDVSRAPDTVALKFLPTGTLTPRQVNQLADMAAREVQFSRAAGHGYAVRTYATLVVDDKDRPALDGAVVLVMERARHSLQGIIDAARAAGTPIPDAARMVADTAAALAGLHAAGWVHGDLKPANVLVSEGGALRLADFGLAAELEGTHAYAPPAGTGDYLPPERWNEQLGERGVVTRTSADIWALGVTAHQLLSGGSYPFPGATVRARVAAAREYAEGGDALRLSVSVPPQWRGFVADCLQPCHASRAGHDAAALAARAERLASGPGGRGAEADGHSGTDETLRSAVPRSRRRLPVTIAAAVSGLALVVTGGAVANAVLTPADFADSEPAATSAMPYRPDLLRTGAGVPERYRPAIVAAGTGCSAPAVSPALVAAMLEAESGFDPHLSDPRKNEYGIARWTPRVLEHYAMRLPDGRTPRPPFPPRQSILALGRYLCWNAPQLSHMRGDHALLLAAAFRTSTETVAVAGGVPARVRPYVRQVEANLERYAPRSAT